MTVSVVQLSVSQLSAQQKAAWSVYVQLEEQPGPLTNRLTDWDAG